MAGSSTFAISPDSLASFRVDSIVCHRGDAFDDSKAYNFADSLIYEVGNSIHPETRESVVKKLLLFDVGDTMNLYELIESERYLREQSYISDAHITREVDKNGKNIIHVKTSDNWTLTIPVSLEKPGNEFYYGIGLQENNFLGFGQTAGFYYGHNEFRDMFSLAYQNSNFLFRHNSLRAVFSKNTDGFSQNFALNFPYLTRTQNQWAYTIEGLRRKQDEISYWSGALPPGAHKYALEADDDTSVIPEYNGEHSNLVMKVFGMREDSASFRLGRSFGGSEFKVYLGATYDYHHTGFDSPEIRRYAFRYEGEHYILDSVAAREEWLPTFSDSRMGGYITVSRIRYDRLINFRSAKWTEDVDKGYSLRVGATRNFEALGAENNDWRLDYNIYLAVGSRTHHLTWQGLSYFYWDENRRNNIYESVTGEYVWKTNNSFSSVLAGSMDTYKRAAYGQQLSLGGLENEHFYGFPSSLFTGQARFFMEAEERFFPKFELGTVVPVFAIFARAGETATAIHEFEPDDLTYAVGFGVRFVMTKSVTRLVNHFDFSWPLNGPLVDPIPRFAFIGLFSL